MAERLDHAGLIWDIAELLRGDYKQSDYGNVILPFTVLRRLYCVLEATKDEVIEAARSLPPGASDELRDMILTGASGVSFYNTSPFTFRTLVKDSANLARNLIAYVQGFSPNLRGVFVDEDKFDLDRHLRLLDGKNLLFKVVERFAAVDLHPERVSNIAMGHVFEELIRKFAELRNEEAGHHFTPREVIRLMVDLLFYQDKEGLTKPGVIRTIYDPACGTGGMLSAADEYIRELNPRATVRLYGQELNGESFGVCRSDMVIKGQEPDNIAFGNTLSDDKFKAERFHYMLCNPPFGVDWKKVEAEVREEADKLGTRGRFGAGLPRISDGQLLFLQHMLAKMRTDDGTRLAIVMNGSPLFTGGAGSGESEIRRWIIENDWLEAIIALPTNIFYDTDIQTYVWVLTDRKAASRRGLIQMIDASGERFWRPMRRSLGEKRRELSADGVKLVARIHGEALDGGGEYHEISRILPSTTFGYRRITVERPLRLRFAVDEAALERLQAKKAVQKLAEADRAELLDTLRQALAGQTWPSREAFRKHLKTVFRATSTLTLGSQLEKAVVEDVHAFLAREVLPHVPDAWIDASVRDEKDDGIGKVGYEINLNRLFYRYQPPRPVAEIDAELRTLETEIAAMLREIAA